MLRLKMLGGPLDGGVEDLPFAGLENIYMPGDWVKEESGDDDTLSRQCRKVYQYRIDSRRRVANYVAEHVERTDFEEVTQMGFKKHGVGEVLPDSDTQHTASQQDWTDSDEQDLQQEDQE